MKRKSRIKLLLNQYRRRKLIIENPQVAQDRQKSTVGTTPWPLRHIDHSLFIPTARGFFWGCCLDWTTERVNVAPDSDALQASNCGRPPLVFSEMLTLEGSRLTFEVELFFKLVVVPGSWLTVVATSGESTFLFFFLRWIDWQSSRRSRPK